MEGRSNQACHVTIFIHVKNRRIFNDTTAEAENQALYTSVTFAQNIISLQNTIKNITQAYKTKTTQAYKTMTVEFYTEQNLTPGLELRPHLLEHCMRSIHIICTVTHQILQYSQLFNYQQHVTFHAAHTENN